MDCALCDGTEQLHQIIAALREDGAGYKRVWRHLQEQGYAYGRDKVESHVLGCLDRTVLSAIGEAEDRGVTIPVDEIPAYFADRGIALPPPGFKVKAATIGEEGPSGNKHWIRITPVEEPNERIEIRQAQPVSLITPPFQTFSYLIKSDWKTWVATPDAQIGFWRDSSDIYHTTHDERCFDLSWQIATAIGNDEGLYGWLDVGDFADLAAPSRFNPTGIDANVKCLNKTWQRGCDEFARRRSLVGEEGEVVVLSGNHDIRLQNKANGDMPYLVGMRRAGDPDDEHPVLSVPYLMRAKDYGVEWVPSFPTAYRRLNSNLVSFHSPAYGGKALDTARKIAARVHASVIFGHTHRRESLAQNVETSKGNRTMEVWSDGTFARTDGSLPSQRNTYDTYGNRLMVDSLPKDWGILSESFHQGLSIIHVEVDGRERFSVERIAIWDGWAQCRGQTFEAGCDVEGKAI